MRQQLLVDGEPVDALVEIFPYFDTHRQPNGRMKVSAEHVPLAVLAPFLRALMRREARLLREDADRVGEQALESRTQDQRRVDALVHLVASIAAARRYTGSIFIETCGNDPLQFTLAQRHAGARKEIVSNEQDHEEILAISRAVDQWADQYLGDDPDWDPLHVVLPLEWCDGFMWMFRVEENDAVIEMYKHGITRRYLMLDQFNRAYRYTGKSHVRIPVAVAVEDVFEGIEEMGWTRETAYDEEFVAEKHRQLREAGWTVITTGTPGSGELLRQLNMEDSKDS